MIKSNFIKNICAAYNLDICCDYEKSNEFYEYELVNYNLNLNSVIENALFIFGLAEHSRMKKDKHLIISYKELIINITDNIIKERNEEKIKKYIVRTAIIYGSMITVNNFLKSGIISKEIKDIKNQVFENNISKGTLVNNDIENEITSDIILSVIPFGLFSPEDLVLLEALKEIEKYLVTENGVKALKTSSKEDTFSTLILALYYAEKGNYNRAKYLLKLSEKLRISNIEEKCIYKLTLNILEKNGMIGENIIIHRPYGNYNRYIHGNDERIPWNPLSKDNVIIKALSWPMNEDMPVNIHINKNNSDIYEIKGEFTNNNEETYWKWDIGCFEEKDQVEYYFSMGSTEKTQIYEFEVPKKFNSTYVKEAKFRDGILKINTNGIDLFFTPMSNGDLNIETKIKDKLFKLIQKGNVEFIEKKDIIELKWFNSVLSINKNPFSFKFYYNDIMCLSTAEDKFLTWYEEKGEILKISCAFEASQNENFYGFGERFNSINQKNNIIDVYVYNEYKNQGKRTYMPQPFFISSNNYGIKVNTDRYVKFDLKYTERIRYSFEAEDSIISFNIIPGSPKNIISKYTDYTGKPKMIPKWALGPWMSSNNWNNDSEVRKQVEITKKLDIPSTVLVIEAWSDEATYYMFNDAVYEENNGEYGMEYKDFRFSEWGRWPDPKALVDYLHDDGLKCILWQIPIIKYMNGIHHIQKDIDEECMINKGYCVKNSDNSPYRISEGWFRNSLIMDFTNHEAVKWWFDKRKYLIDELNIDGFKTDGGEFVFGSDLIFNDGRTGADTRNTYPNDYIKAYYEFINEHKPEGGMTFSRAGFTGAQNYPAHWAGDENSTFTAFRNSIIAGINSGMCGISFWGWDIGGFSGDIPTAELFIRASEMAAFCPIMQYHAESKAEFNQDRTPWNIAERTGDNRVIECYRYYANLRMNLLPYIYNESLKYSETGIPLMRALFIEYPDDKNCETIMDEYMFGDSMLIAPIVYEKMNGRDVYLPEGKWINIFDGQIYKGKIKMYFSCSLENILVFVKYNSGIPMNLNSKFKMGDKISNSVTRYENLCFVMFGDDIKNYSFRDDFNNNIMISGSKDNFKLLGDISMNDYKIIYYKDLI